MHKKYFICFDIGGTNARVSLVCHSETLQILTSQKHSIRENHSPDAIATLVFRLSQELCHLHHISLDLLSGIGIALAGQIDASEEIVRNAPNLDWQNVPIIPLLKEKFSEHPNLPIRLINDLNAIAWGEYKLGKAAKYANVLVVYVGTGIGSGIIINGQLYNGSNNVSGEIGHVKFPSSPNLRCGCNQFGCVEAFHGGKAIERRLQEDLDAATVTREELQLASAEHPTARAIEAAFSKNLPYACTFWETTANQLASLLAAAIVILNPSALILGGGVLDNCPHLRNLILQKLPQLVPQAAYQDLEFISPILGDDAGTLGAALLF